MRIGMLMSPHALRRSSPLMPEVVGLLREWGAAVDVIHPDDACASLGALRVEHDLYVLKTRSELGLSLAGALHAVGAPILNPWPAAVLMRDRVAGLRRLLAAGVPVPETWVVSSEQRLARLLDEGPVVVKPFAGARVQARVVWDAGELDEAAGEAALLSGGPVLAQRYHEPDGPEGFERKIFCIGGQLFGVLRSSSARGYREKCGEPFTLGPELREVALRCATAFGVELFGMDVVLSGGAPYVVDVHSFPGFKGVPDAALRLADYVYAATHDALAGRPRAGPAAPSGAIAEAVPA